MFSILSASYIYALACYVYLGGSYLTNIIKCRDHDNMDKTLVGENKPKVHQLHKGYSELYKEKIAIVLL